MTPRLYIFDADDTLRRTLVPGQPSPHTAQEWELLPQVRPRLAQIPWSETGPFLGIASNQDQVGYGLISAATAYALLEAMVLAAVGPIAPPPAIRFCPHPYFVHCACRKPAPGLLHAIMDHFRAAPRETLFVGDAPSDREAARRARVGFVSADEFFGR